MTDTSSAPIPVLDLGPEIEALRPEFEAAFARVLESGQFIGGPEVEAFEAEAAEALGAAHAVGLNSGTDALVIALRALGVGPGDEVVTTPFTFFATAEAVSILGATPVFVDVDEASYNLDPDALDAAVTERTRAILPVHLYGRPASMTRILVVAERHGIPVVEDCAQSFGARYGGDPAAPDAALDATLRGRTTGTMGALGCFSFFPSKNLGALGDGGMLTTDDAELARLARMLRAHGGVHKYNNEMPAYNSRLDSLQAALLRVKLPLVEAANAARRTAASRYTDALADVEGVVPPKVPEGHVFHQYTVRIRDGRRDAVAEALEAAGIQTMVYYPIPVHQLPVYAGEGWGPFPVAERLASEVLSLPIGPSLGKAEQDRVVDALRRSLALPTSPDVRIVDAVSSSGVS